MLLTSIAGWAPYTGPGPACCLLLASGTTAQRKEGLEIKSCEAGVSCHVELWPTQQHSVG